MHRLVMAGERPAPKPMTHTGIVSSPNNFRTEFHFFLAGVAATGRLQLARQQRQLFLYMAAMPSKVVFKSVRMALVWPTMLSMTENCLR